MCYNININNNTYEKKGDIMCKVKEYSSNEEWLNSRAGKITGSGAKDWTVKPRAGVRVGDDIYSSPQFQNASESIALYKSDANKGHELEVEALAEYVKLSGIKSITALENIVIYNNNLQVSPDACIGDIKDNVFIETKCLSIGKHIAFAMTGDFSEFKYQIASYFLVGAKEVHLVYYCPALDKCRVVAKVLHKEDVDKEIEEIKVICEKQYKLTQQLNEFVNNSDSLVLV